MIGAIVAVYSVYPEKLFESCLNPDIKVRWYVFFHGSDLALQTRLKQFAATTPNVTLLLHRANRGLAQSWNDALRFSEGYDDEFALILNDDLHFQPGGLLRFVEFVRDLPDDFGLATVMGLEIGDSPETGRVLAQELACCVIGKAAISKIGYFDQTYTPAYFEDIDYLYRLRLAGLSIKIDERVLVEHERSKTLRTDEALKTSLASSFVRNRDYFIRKWGGVFDSASFKCPFDDPASQIFISYENAANPYPSNSREVLSRTRTSNGANALDAIGRQTGTEKASTKHDFLIFYERFLSSRRTTLTSVLEIGTGSGASLRMWEQYFPNAKIASIDTDRNAKQYQNDRITIGILDQSNPKQLADFAVENGPFDLVVDDGSHFWDHQILSLQVLFPFLTRGGHYIVENLDTSYGNYIALYSNGAKTSAADYIKRMMDRLLGDSALDKTAENDLFIKYYAKYIDSISFYPRTCVIVRNDK